MADRAVESTRDRGTAIRQMRSDRNVSRTARRSAAPRCDEPYDRLAQHRQQTGRDSCRCTGQCRRDRHRTVAQPSSRIDGQGFGITVDRRATRGSRHAIEGHRHCRSGWPDAARGKQRSHRDSHRVGRGMRCTRREDRMSKRKPTATMRRAVLPRRSTTSTADRRDTETASVANEGDGVHSPAHPDGVRTRLAAFWVMYNERPSSHAAMSMGAAEPLASPHQVDSVTKVDSCCRHHSTLRSVRVSQSSRASGRTLVDEEGVDAADIRHVHGPALSPPRDERRGDNELHGVAGRRQQLDSCLGDQRGGDQGAVSQRSLS